MPRVRERGAAARQIVSHEKSISRSSNIPAVLLGRGGEGQGAYLQRLL